MDKYKKSLVLNWLLFVIYSSINSYLVYHFSHAWPSKGNFLWFLLIFFCPPFLYHFVAITYTLITKEILIQQKTLRLITLIIGVLLAGGLLQYSQKNSLQQFIHAYAPMIEKIAQNMPTPCEYPYFKMSTIDRYNKKVNLTPHSSTQQPMAQLWYNPQGFILHFVAGTIDIAGGAFFYNSEQNKWQLFRNADQQKLDLFKHKLSGLKKCASQFT
jgi:hypothetical protein